MNSFGKAIMQRVFDRNGTAGDLARLPPPIGTRAAL